MAKHAVVDARGLSCPEPVMMAREAITKADKGTIEILVDTGTSRDNVRRLAERVGWKVTLDAQPDGGYRLVLTK